MARQEKIVLWIDRRWLTAIEKRLNGQTLQEHMEDVLDELCNQLPEREYARISKAIQAESTAAREREEAAQTWSAYRVLENGEEWCFKVAPGEELLNAAERLNRYLKEPPDTGSKFIRLFSCGTLLTSEEYQQMIAERMENTGKVRGVFELDFDKREFSAFTSWMAGGPGRCGMCQRRCTMPHGRNSRRAMISGASCWII